MSEDTGGAGRSENEIGRLIPPFRSRERFTEVWTTFRELHLYKGSRCNRTCAFCVVKGNPRGWSRPFTAEMLQVAARLVAPDGNLKIYGGEPTLDAEDTWWAMEYLRGQGFTGWFTLFTNGVLAERLTRLLDADRRTEAVLNYSILYGRDAEPLPSRSLDQLLAYARRRPGILFTSHPDLLPVGPGATYEPDQPRTAFEGSCPRCPPVLTTAGRLHACPFAVELSNPHYQLGTVREGAEDGFDRWIEFRKWIETTLMPQAQALGTHPCRVCTAHAGGVLPAIEKGG